MDTAVTTITRMVGKVKSLSLSFPPLCDVPSPLLRDITSWYLCPFMYLSLGNCRNLTFPAWSCCPMIGKPGIICLQRMDADILIRACQSGPYYTAHWSHQRLIVVRVTQSAFGTRIRDFTLTLVTADAAAYGQACRWGNHLASVAAHKLRNLYPSGGMIVVVLTGCCSPSSLFHQTFYTERYFTRFLLPFDIS